MAGPETYIPQVGLHCWVFLGGRDDVLSEEGLEPLHFLDPQLGISKDKERDDFVQQAILGKHGIGSATIVSHFCSELERESLLAQNCQQILGAFLTFAFCPLLTPSFFKHKAHVSLVRTINRIVCGGESYLERVRVWQLGWNFHQYVFVSLSC